jgi:cysteine synthase A
MVQKAYDLRLRRLSSLIGNTPLLAIEFLYRSEKRTIYAKAEYLNLTGSIKDRMAFNIMKQGYARGTLKPGSHIIEVTSGNTGISFAAIGRALGHPVTIFMPDWVSRERIKLLQAYGADMVLFSKGESSFQDSICRAEELASSCGDAFLPAQFANRDNIAAHYETTGPEIWYQLRFHTISPDAFIAGVGTGGTIMGVARFLKKCDPTIKTHPLEPAGFPLAGADASGNGHRIEGIADGFLPPLLDSNVLDPVVCVADGDAILIAQKLAAELGLGVGISAGANFLGALQVQEEMGSGAVVVTVFPDDNKKYLSTDLFGTEPIHKGFLAPGITLLGVESLKRVCYTCCVPEECLQSAPLDFSREVPPPPCPRRLRTG